MKGYKGKIGFYKRRDTGELLVQEMPHTQDPEKMCAAYWIYLGVCIDVDVTFADTRQQEIDALNAAIERERAESQHKINIMLGKIQELQALEHIESN